MRSAATRQEERAGRNSAAVESDVAHSNLSRSFHEALGQVLERALASQIVGLRWRHGSAAVRTAPDTGVAGSSSGALTALSGATASRRSAPPMTAENTGAETCPP